MDPKTPKTFEINIDISKHSLAELVVLTAPLGRKMQRAVIAIKNIMAAAEYSNGVVRELEYYVSKVEGDFTKIVTTTTLLPENQEQRTDPVLPMDTPLEEFAKLCSFNMRKVFAQLKLKTLGELMSKSADDILNLKGVGAVTLEEIRALLSKLGTSLKDDEMNTHKPGLRIYEE